MFLFIILYFYAFLGIFGFTTVFHDGDFGMPLPPLLPLPPSLSLPLSLSLSPSSLAGLDGTGLKGRSWLHRSQVCDDKTFNISSGLTFNQRAPTRAKAFPCYTFTVVQEKKTMLSLYWALTCTVLRCLTRASIHPPPPPIKKQTLWAQTWGSRRWASCQAYGCPRSTAGTCLVNSL